MARDPGSNAKTSPADGPGLYPRCNFSATVPPTASDDSTAGYEVGSIWCDITGQEAYVCLDASGAAAVWSAITSVPGPDSISGLKNWWRTDDVDLNGSRISAVNFKVAGSKDLAKGVAGQQPLLLTNELNGQDIAQHTDARSDQLNNSGDLGAAAIPADSDWTMFYLFRGDTWVNNNRILTCRRNSDSNQVLGCIMDISPDRVLCEFANGSVSLTRSVTEGSFHLLRLSYEDGVEVTAEIDNGTRASTAVGAYSAVLDKVVIPNASVHGDFSWGDLFMYDKLLNATEDQVIYDYANSFWGLSL